MPESKPDAAPSTVFVVLGVSGSGKSTIASLLAERLGIPFGEGDDLHPQANVEKMASGHPLNDDDRMPWLARVADWVDSRLDAGECGVISCSALKRSYREIVNRRGRGVVFVYLAAEERVITERLAHRKGHFMPSSLLASQFATLEVPTPDEPAIAVDAHGTPDEIVDAIIDALPQETGDCSASRQPNRPAM